MTCLLACSVFLWILFAPSWLIPYLKCWCFSKLQHLIWAACLSYALTHFEGQKCKVIFRKLAFSKRKVSFSYIIVVWRSVAHGCPSLWDVFSSLLAIALQKDSPIHARQGMWTWKSSTWDLNSIGLSLKGKWGTRLAHTKLFYLLQEDHAAGWWHTFLPPSTSHFLYI